MPELNPWNIAATPFPAQGSPAEQWRHLLHYAVLAPSGHNTQPWLFKIEDDAVEIYTDRSHNLPDIDPGDRELIMSCGAALFNLRLAMRHFGIEPEVELLPDASQSDLMARIRRGGAAQSTPDEERLFAAIPLRRTHREPFEARAVPDDLLNELQSAAQKEGVWLQPIESADDRRKLRELIAHGLRYQGNRAAVELELEHWTMPDIDDERAVPRPPALAVLGTEKNRNADWLRTGQALCRVLLRAMADGVYASFLSQSIEATGEWRELRKLLGRDDFPQLVLRLGYGRDIPPAPRRSLQEVLKR